MWIFSYSEAHTPCRVDAMCFGRALQWGEWPCLARQMVAVCHAWEDCHWVFWWWAMLGHSTNSSKMTPGYNWGENNMKYNSLTVYEATFFSIHFKWEHTGGDRSQAEMAQKCFWHFFESEHDLSDFSLTYPCNVGGLRYFKFPLYFLLKATFLGIALWSFIIGYFETPAISNYFSFPLRVRNRKC